MPILQRTHLGTGVSETVNGSIPASQNKIDNETSKQAHANATLTFQIVKETSVFPSKDIEVVVCILQGWWVDEDFRGTQVLAVTQEGVQILRAVSITKLGEGEQMRKQLDYVLSPLMLDYIQQPPKSHSMPFYKGWYWKDVLQSFGVDVAYIKLLLNGQQVSLQHLPADFISMAQASASACNAYAQRDHEKVFLKRFYWVRAEDGVLWVKVRMIRVPQSGRLDYVEDFKPYKLEEFRKLKFGHADDTSEAEVMKAVMEKAKALEEAKALQEAKALEEAEAPTAVIWHAWLQQLFQSSWMCIAQRKSDLRKDYDRQPGRFQVEPTSSTPATPLESPARLSLAAFLLQKQTHNEVTTTSKKTSKPLPQHLPTSREDATKRCRQEGPTSKKSAYSERIQTVCRSASADPELVPVLWFRGVQNLDSGVVLQSALVLVAPNTVQLLRLHLTETQEAKNLNFVPDDSTRVVSDEAYHELMTGVTLPLAKCSHFVQDRASKMSLSYDFQLKLTKFTMTRMRGGRGREY
ncbi:hypothetical protein BKA63DRAFT_497710 [Paraphoma chrysanthemicola]|nr:hypothetical protein BKA63DRAFT_497710 [Paraphoma chrysanthemicola]